MVPASCVGASPAIDSTDSKHSDQFSPGDCLLVCVCAHVCVHLSACEAGQALPGSPGSRKKEKHRKQKTWAVGLPLRAEGPSFVHRPPCSGQGASLIPWRYRKEQPWNSPESSGLNCGPPNIPKCWGGRSLIQGLTCRSIRWFQA